MAGLSGVTELTGLVKVLMCAHQVDKKSLEDVLICECLYVCVGVCEHVSVVCWLVIGKA